MFNLLISSREDSWKSGSFEMDKSRVINGYTAEEIKQRFKSLSPKVIKEIKSFPCLFVVEREVIESRVGWITGIRVREASVVIKFEFDPIFPPLAPGAIEALRSEIDLGRWELGNTHWAIKDEPIFEILERHGFVTPQQVHASLKLAALSSPDPVPTHTPTGEFDTKQVFVVHGHDEIAKLEMAEFVRSVGLEPIILHMQASSGRTIIEKIESYSNVGFGVVLYTPCDTGAPTGCLTARYRARQNVVFEHGFLIGKLGRSRVAAMVKGPIETPNDISGVVYIQLDSEERWKDELTKEMRAAGYQV
ncbi:nucleotide-binding protein [Stenotrophomonas maltophilia]|uniref:TIR domain-containing protein n=1 Tax=Stenotrophomonas maltophilia TaxID=40324 RepID=UPI00209B4AAD|nr:nucleotide-binding protein [Stenotrophomonas maltophilia]MCO7496508.1 nucleotide-binding protein [Stenotrophomonas maltophilia]MDZ5841974.1 nucleotide-binding protein [Stenotrophomonas maltophilia]